MKDATLALGLYLKYIDDTAEQAKTSRLTLRGFVDWLVRRQAQQEGYPPPPRSRWVTTPHPKFVVKEDKRYEQQGS